MVSVSSLTTTTTTIKRELLSQEQAFKVLIKNEILCPKQYTKRKTKQDSFDLEKL
jgi:hypothetical protein